MNVRFVLDEYKAIYLPLNAQKLQRVDGVLEERGVRRRLDDDLGGDFATENSVSRSRGSICCMVFRAEGGFNDGNKELEDSVVKFCIGEVNG